MTRKVWSYVFFVVSAVSMGFTLLLHHHWRLASCASVLLCLTCGLLLRRTMIDKAESEWRFDDWKREDMAEQ